MSETPYFQAWKKFTHDNLGIFDPTNLGPSDQDRQKFLTNRIRTAFDAGWNAGLARNPSGKPE